MQVFKDRGSISGFRVELPEQSGCPISHFGEYLLSKDHVVPSHRHKNWELVLQTEASSRWSDSSRDVEIERGELLICPPGLKHAKSGGEKSDYRICFVGCEMDTGLWPRLRLHLSRQRFTKVKKAREAAKFLHTLHEELLFNKPLQEEGVILAWKQLWLYVYRVLTNTRSPASGEMRWLAQRVRTVVEADLGEIWSLETAARFFGYAPNYFSELFRRESGQTFHQFLMETRIKAAQTALERGEQTVTEIAFSLGFSSSQHFSRVFGEKTGISPTHWVKASTSRRQRAKP